jgi:lipoprotein-anchoring transpeptidase ErfK/SrfK
VTIRPIRAAFCGVLGALIAAGAGCGGSAGGEPAPAAEAAPATTTVTAPTVTRTRCEEGAFRRLETSRVAFGAAVRTRAIAYVRPYGRPIARFGRLNVNRVPTVFGAVGEVVDRDCRPRWYRVKLPRRPNGVMGWVRASDVTVLQVRTRIVVDLSERRVTLYRDGRRVLTTRAAIGSSATPTPTGSYYVNQRLVPADPTGPFGPGAIGISAFSEVLTGWTQGGPIAIHGTDRPDLIGQAVSNGCIRVRNDVLRRLFAVAISGTPVEVRA